MQTLLMKNLKQKPFVFSVKIGCISGFIGKNCRSTCAYPYYGVDFQGQSDCDEESRDFFIGYTNITKGIASAFTLVKFLIANSY